MESTWPSGLRRPAIRKIKKKVYACKEKKYIWGSSEKRMKEEQLDAMKSGSCVNLDEDLLFRDLCYHS